MAKIKNDKQKIEEARIKIAKQYKEELESLTNRNKTLKNKVVEQDKTIVELLDKVDSLESYIKYLHEIIEISEGNKEFIEKEIKNRSQKAEINKMYSSLFSNMPGF